MPKQSNDQNWFRKVRGSYLPSSPIGALTYIPYIVYLVGVLVFVLYNKYSFWAAVFTIIPNWVAAVVILNWIADKKS